MDLLKEFHKIMEEQSDIALATSVNDIPNVRIVSFYFCPDENILYFGTFKDEVKTKEFEKNNKVSFTTIPKESEEFARTNCGIVKKSDLPMSDFKQVICEKVPSYKEIIDNFEEKLVLYEISFKEVAITINYDEYKIAL